MATTHICGLTQLENRTVQYSMGFLVQYAENGKKTREGELVTFENCSPEFCAEEMLQVQAEYEAATGRDVSVSRKGAKSYLMFEIRQSYLPGEIDAEKAHELGCTLAREWLGDRYQYVVGTHVDRDHVHSHIRWNAVGFDLHKYHMNKYTHLDLQRRSDEQCLANGLSVVIAPKQRGDRQYSKPRRALPFRTILRNDIDRCVDQSARYEDFIEQMKRGYYVKSSGKYLSFRHKTNGQQRNIRSYTLGDAYRETALRDRIAGVYAAPAQSPPTRTYSEKLREVQSVFAAKEVLRDISTWEELQERIDTLGALAGEAGRALEAAYETSGDDFESGRALDGAQKRYVELQSKLGGLYEARRLLQSAGQAAKGPRQKEER